jgi:transcriptional regulator with XRE-family HTH domain
MAAQDDFGSAMSPLRVFGAELRHYRTRAGWSQEQLGARVYCSADLVGKVENGQRAPTEEFAAACDAIPELGTDGALGRLRELLKGFLKQRAYPGWFLRWPDKEASATTLRWFEPMVVPGLLQTEDYATAIFRTRVGATEDEIGEMVAARVDRQLVLDRDPPPMLWVVVDEGVLRRPVGGKHVMREQLNKLMKAARRPNVVVQVIPASVGAHEGLRGGAFVIADSDEAPSLAYQDTAARGQVIEDAEGIAGLTVLWDTLRAEALPRAASLQLIEEVAKTWTLAMTRP